MRRPKSRFPIGIIAFDENELFVHLIQDCPCQLQVNLIFLLVRLLLVACFEIAKSLTLKSGHHHKISIHCHS